MQGVTEPYRMFTSRAEYRLLLRADNADIRLTPKAASVGLVQNTDERILRLTEKKNKITTGMAALKQFSLTPAEWVSNGIHMNQDGIRRTAADLLAGKADVSIANLALKWPAHFAGLSASIIPYLEAECRYSVVLERQQREVMAFKKDEEISLPPDLDYYALSSLSNEGMISWYNNVANYYVEKEKLNMCRPLTIGAAGRISGVTPTAMLHLHRYINKLNSEKHARVTSG